MCWTEPSNTLRIPWKAWSQKNEGCFSIRLMFMVLDPGNSSPRLLAAECVQGQQQTESNLQRRFTHTRSVLWSDLVSQLFRKVSVKTRTAEGHVISADRCNHTAYTWLHSPTWNLALRVYNPSR